MCSTAAASRATRWCAASSRSSTAGFTVWTATGAPAPTATCSRTTSSSPPQAPRRDSSCSSGGASGIRMRTTRCSGRSTRMISGPTARTPVISAIFARTVSSGSASRCRQTSGSSIPRPTCRRTETDRRRVADGADRQRCPAHGPRRHQSLVPRPQRDRRIPVGWPRRHASGAGARGARRTTRRFWARSRQRLLDDLASFQRVLFTNPRVRALSDAIRAGDDPVAGSRSAARRARSAGQGRVRARVRPVPRRSLAVERARSRSFDSTASEPVSASDRYASDQVVTPARFAFAACPPRLARNARTYEIALSVPTPSPGRGSPCRDQGSPDQLRSRLVRFLTGFVGGPGRSGRLGQIRHARTSRDQEHSLRTSTTTARPRWKRWSTTTSSSSSSRVRSALPAATAAGRLSTDGINVDRQPSPEERAALLAYLRKL